MFLLDGRLLGRELGDKPVPLRAGQPSRLVGVVRKDEEALDPEDDGGQRLQDQEPLPSL